MNEAATSEESLAAFQQSVAHAAKCLAPPPNLTVSEWADTYRILPAGSSPEAGKWRTDRFPPMREIMDSMSDPLVEEAWFMKSSQVGATELICNIIGYFAHQDPSPILCIRPSEDEAKGWSAERLAPTIQSCPALREVFADVKGRDGGNTLLRKSFIGGYLALVGANAPAGLASRPIRVLLGDEVGRYPASAGTEGDPVDLGRKRTNNYHNRKMFFPSTPGVKGYCRVEKGYLTTDQRKYFVPCPKCGHEQVLRWPNVEWPEGDTAAAAYRCEGCAELIPHSKKKWMVENGHWEATAESSRPGLVGFFINELYSPWSSWTRMANEFLVAKRNPESLKTWINTSLGETWEEEGEKFEGIDLYNRREKWDADVPDAVKVLTAAVDVQDDRLEISVIGWGDSMSSYTIDHMIVHGNPTQDAVWDDAQRVITDTRFQREDGREMVVQMTGADTGGHHTTRAYRWCAKNKHNRFLAFRGHSTPGKPIIDRPTRLHKHNCLLYTIGTDTAKDVLMGRLPLGIEDAGALHFPWHLDPEYFEQLTAEKRITTFKNGVPVSKYIKVRPRNEALDLWVYNFAVLTAMNLDLENMDPAVVETPQTGQQVNASHGSTTIRSSKQSFINRGQGSWIRR